MRRSQNTIETISTIGIAPVAKPLPLTEVGDRQALNRLQARSLASLNLGFVHRLLRQRWNKAFSALAPSMRAS
jgi:hypothetical protein